MKLNYEKNKEKGKEKKEKLNKKVVNDIYIYNTYRSIKIQTPQISTYNAYVQIKNATSAITLIALVITIIVLLILAGVSIAMLTGENGILNQANKAKQETEVAKQEEQLRIDNYEQYIQNSISSDKSGANAPIKKDGMEFIKYNENSKDWEVVTDESSDWYSYEETTDEDMTDGGTTNGGNSRWANGRLNGNYYVWIPRYAYKIDNSVTYTSQTGTSHKIDVKFIGLDVTSSNVGEKIGEGYIVHPGFKFGEKELTGIWVGKYETGGSIEQPTILLEQTSLRDIDVSTMFNTAKKLSTQNYDAHMMKNIEWGAVVYLAQSKYGRNGTEISINQCSDFYTGAGSGVGENKIWNSTYILSEITEEQKYNGNIGKLASTTGNAYGIYDMSGGAWEYVMGFYGEITPELGNTGFTGNTIPDKKYYDLYTRTSPDSTNIGDALFETHSWNLDYSNFVRINGPVFARGGNYSDINGAGLFSFAHSNGNNNINGGFRICILDK